MFVIELGGETCSVCFPSLVHFGQNITLAKCKVTYFLMKIFKSYVLHNHIMFN